MMCNTAGVLTTEDKQYIEDRVEKKIDNLAVIIQTSFKNVDERFEQIDKKFKAVDERFDKIDYRLDVIEYKLVGGQYRRLEKVEDDVRALKTKLNLN